MLTTLAYCYITGFIQFFIILSKSLSEQGYKPSIKGFGLLFSASLIWFILTIAYIFHTEE